MKQLLHLFPANDFSLIGVILVLPLIGAFVNGVFGRRLGKDAVRLMALAAVGVSFAAAVAAFMALNHVADSSATKVMVHGHEVAKTGHVRLAWTAWEWMRASGPRGTAVPIELRFSIDALSAVMMLVVTGVGLLIHVYATEYMWKDPGYARFFCYLNLFIFSMLVLILGDNLPVLFIGWEGVGLCSYLLIGFWYKKLPNATAGKKAFIANRIGDFGLIVGMFLLLAYTGALDWDGMEKKASLLLDTGRDGGVHLWPIGGGTFQDTHIAGIRIPLSFLQPKTAGGAPTSWTITAATAIGLALFLGCTGKSAQIPLYVWLPDAMAGPTPVSALIHAATMVTAGIYLVCRMSFVFVLSPAAMSTIAMTGALTAFFAATIAVVQNDIKKILAYSTVSQLGYMFIGVGVGAFTAGFFHVFTHAFFKACLFLGAGSVIHAMHQRVHDEERSQDVRNMGGLRKYMPLTYWTFLASTLCLIGFPLTSGFFSKDEILGRALVTAPAAAENAKIWSAPGWLPWVVWGLGVAAAALTAFYMTRCVVLTFFGDFRGWTIGRPSQLPKSSRAPLAAAHDDHGDDEEEHHHDEDLSQPGPPPHESPRPMTIPLIILAASAVVAGIFNPAALKLINHHFDFLPLEHWMTPVFEPAETHVKLVAASEVGRREIISLLAAMIAFAGGTYVAYWMYLKEKGKPAREAALKLPGLYRWALAKWKVDEAYDKTVIAGVDALADTAASVDQSIVDFLIARLTALVVSATGTILRVMQNGVVHVYAGAMVVGIVVLGWFFIAPHADITVVDAPNGDYTLVAGPGATYAYRWYPDAKKPEPQDKTFKATSTELKIHLEEGKSQTVKLEVKNFVTEALFGWTSTREVKIERPREKGQQPAQIQLGER